MLKIIKKQFLHFFRKLLGTEQILQKLQLQQLQQQLLLLGNGIKYFFTEPEKVKETTTYKRCAEIISLLSLMDIEGAKYVRIGGDYDGGYVMVDNFERVEAAYSFGIGGDVSWEEGIALRGHDVFMYDHTIERLPKDHPKFHYFKVGVTGYGKGANLKTLSELIAENNHTASKNLIMKIDIEGCEWDVFKETSSVAISQFSQIIVEFHNLVPAAYGSKHDLIMEVLKKIKLTHQSVHVHANNYGLPLWIGQLVLPSILEVTYVRRADFKNKFIANTRQFPTDIDLPNIVGFSDIYMGNFIIDEDLGKNRFCLGSIFTGILF